jgi:hypothetical protein
MRKQKLYKYIRFAPEVIVQADARIREIASKAKQSLDFAELSVEHDDSNWRYDSVEEFFADYRKYKNESYLYLSGGPFVLVMSIQSTSVNISVQAQARADIESVFSIFEAAQDSSRIPAPAAPARVKLSPTIFIGHGRSPLWRDLKDHLHEKHGFKVEAYETGA